MSRRQWKEACVGTLLAVLAVVALGAGYVSDRSHVAQVEWPKRLGELGAASAGAAPIITALQRYTRATGTPPSSLSALTPAFLTVLPAPGTAARDGKWFYRPQAEGQPPGDWVVGIRLRKDFCPRCGWSFGDYFVYHSNGSYPRSAYGGILERIGAWGYYHE